ncbi:MULTISPECIES: ATP-binding protein [Deferribacter]|uniref:ATP-binding protein n=1 Tax=Deferribacter autotrophicus TaxID=500465 RepID=A0A5A8F1N2_9BACT|nr:ATP-binding protein [Deferribacter autotrophicus]KAA0257641.1 ATP-binding protein [Deferribacter autotrophicus]
MLIRRIIQEEIEKRLFKGKAVIIYGARQVGKTTLVKQIANKYKDESIYLNCDEPDIRDKLFNKTSTELKHLIGNKKLVIIDEAQRVKDVGLTLKLIVDNFREIQVIATGSSSFDLSNDISEPLTGRKYEFFLPPFSIEELREIYSDIELNRILENLIIYGMYPETVLNCEDREINLKSLADSYLFKDILMYQNIKNPDILRRLLQALALQIGNEVSYTELSKLLGIDKKTVESYINILEQAFIIFRLNPFSSNLRKELKKLRKIYFYDTGIRNALINNFNPSYLRQDWGALWENFVIIERIKYLRNHLVNKSYFFWRNIYKQEVDYLEFGNDKIYAFEIKWKKDRSKLPNMFNELYPNNEFIVVNKENFLDVIYRA